MASFAEQLDDTSRVWRHAVLGGGIEAVIHRAHHPFSRMMTSSIMVTALPTSP
jgi:hypothetical protein